MSEVTNLQTAEVRFKDLETGKEIVLTAKELENDEGHDIKFNFGEKGFKDHEDGLHAQFALIMWEVFTGLTGSQVPKN